MSDYDFSVDDILAEFYSDIESSETEKKAEVKSSNSYSPDETHVYEAVPNERTVKKAQMQTADDDNANSKARQQLIYEQQTAEMARAQERRRIEEIRKSASAKEAMSRSEDTSDPFAEDDEEEEFKVKRAPRQAKAGTQRKNKTPIYSQPNKKFKRDSLRLGTIKLLGAVFALVSVVILAWVGVNIHPESDTMTYSKQDTRTDLTAKLSNYAVNSKADVLSSVEEIAQQAVIKKVYKIPEEQTVAPEPLASGFGKVSIENAQYIMEIIAQAEESGLLDGQQVLFSPDADFYYDSDIQYYIDDTIMVICWKELVENRVTSCVEVKIADGSQIRRKLCEDTYGSSVYLYCSELAEQANAVVAMNSDYYAFRDLGITCYNRTVYRFNEYGYYGTYKAYNVTDTLFIDENGDFVIFKRGTETTKDALQQWVYDNNLLYSIAFGPLLVENYELVDIPDYPVGEINSEYSRAGIAQVDSLHYLYMAVSHSNDSTPRCNVHQFAEMFYNRGVKIAYCFDGGQTGEVYFQGEPYNYIDWGNERTVSDIIYFASALGGEAVQ